MWRPSVIGAITFAVACGGAVAPLDEAPKEKASTTTQAITCDSGLVRDNAPCEGERSYCEVGADPRGSCNDWFDCKGGRWKLRNIEKRSACPSAKTTRLAEHNPDCPDARGANDATCAIGLDCIYSSGLRCVCTSDILDGVSGGRLRCSEWNVGCPAERPMAGTSCSKDATPRGCDYDYGHCGPGADRESTAYMRCDEGRWQAGCWD